jgi:hypothetical protein
MPSHNTCDHVCEEPGECRLNLASPLSVPGAARAVSSLPRGGGDRWFAFIKAHLSLRCPSHLIPGRLTLVRAAPATGQ